MVRRTYSGLEICKVLEAHGFDPVGGSGDSHRKLIYKDNETGEKRVVTVPMHDEIRTGTLKSIMEQAGGHDFGEFLELDRTPERISSRPIDGLLDPLRSGCRARLRRLTTSTYSDQGIARDRREIGCGSIDTHYSERVSPHSPRRIR
jgi:predicted RNA binding protein YcfA (HicA-like mRNA interferase family)